MKCFQPHDQTSIDERMVQNKGTGRYYGFRQYMKDKPTKWVLTDSLTGPTYNFDLYILFYNF